MEIKKIFIRNASTETSILHYLSQSEGMPFATVQRSKAMGITINATAKIEVTAVREAPDDEDDDDDPLAAAPAEVGGEVALAPTPPRTTPVLETVGSPLPIAIAAAWKLANVLFPEVGGLITPTIPMPQ